ncbi:MAG: calcium-translocating P-type ATPase, PMCA-type [Clostridia bacterium]|nr:calcium-translocating P-type ATPase, PMCA-type [Clostridia bacterium]
MADLDREKLLRGLSSKEVEESRKVNGSNTLTEIPPDPLWKKVLEGFKDPMIMILLVALAIQVVLWLMGKAEWYEPVCVLVAILLANGVASISEHNQEGKAGALKAEAESKEMTKVMRDGQLHELHVSEVVVGDIVYLQAGDKISADGEIVDGEVMVDQAALNGETEEARKGVNAGGGEYNIKDLLNTCYAYRGTVVVSGEAYMQVKVVGDKTLFGELALEVQEDSRETPLQVKLGKLAQQISTFGYIGAVAIIIAVIAINVFGLNGIPFVHTWENWLKLIIEAVTVAVTIIVCAVPEGLPMLTSMLLSFQSIRMIKDNVLVRKINGLETAGSLSLLFTDKTGTITEGRLSVVELATGNQRIFTKLSELPATMRTDIVTGIGINNSATVSGNEIIGGNSTDRAMMAFLMGENAVANMSREDVISFNPFNSTKKMSDVTVTVDGKSMTYLKGAPERIIERCSSFIDETGAVKPLNHETQSSLLTYMDAQAGRSMRLLGVAKTDGDPDGRDLTLVCVLSIRDNVRKEVIPAIEEVQNAGIQVVMVTGDRKETAVAIAREAGLLKLPSDVAMTSAEMAEKTDDELKAILPNLRVVARALPTDKSRLVRVTQELNLVVGMTGDGVNDSPALKKADVGFAMGSGTEVAKEAGDITILDDNFTSIDKAILYGRTMFKSIRKFLIFQLTVNVAAVLTCFLAPFFGENQILTVVQLLLINLAMDTLAAIAFGSEPTLKEYMKEKPVPRDASIVSGSMLVQIIVSALYITAACLCIRFVPAIQNLIGATSAAYGMEASMMHVVWNSAVFATFMMAIAFNGFNARTTHMNVFEHLSRNRNFILVMLAIFVMQFIFVTVGGEVLSVHALTSTTWFTCAAIAFLVIPLDMIRKAVLRGKE